VIASRLTHLEARLSEAKLIGTHRNHSRLRRRRHQAVLSPGDAGP
jgi:hypothetical protein